jgi:hypothetical protein
MSASKHITVERELDNAEPIGTYTMILRDRNQNIVKQGTYPIHSIVQQYWEVLYNTANAVLTKSLRGVNGTTSQVLQMLNMRGCNLQSGFNDSRGIVVGTSSTAVQFNNLGLGGFIRTGSSANQLTYGLTDVTYDAATGKVTLTQTFTNDAVSTEPTINEVGIACFQSGSDNPIMIVRDVPGSSYAMLLDAVLTVSYEFQLPFGCQNHAMLFARHQIARNISNLELYDSGGTLVSNATYASTAGAMGFVSGIGDDTRGIIIGNSSAAETFNTFAIGTKIPHGTNTGDLFHYESTISTLEIENVTTNTTSFYLSRVFLNKTASSIDINEIGLSSNIAIGTTNNSYLFDRRVLPSPISVASNESVTITWRYKYTFS